MGEEGFEDLLGGETDFLSDGDGGEVFGIDLVGAELVVDAERVEKAGGISFRGRAGLHPLVPAVSMIWPCRMVRVRSARGWASPA